MLWIFLAFVVVPVVEIWLITVTAGQLGWPLALLLVIGVSMAGAWLVRREGVGVVRRVQENLRSARMPTTDLADGAMIFFAAALMLTPGFLTDAVGLALLIPPIRAILRPPLIAYFRRRVEVRIAGPGVGGPDGHGFGGRFGSRPTPRADTGPDVLDVDGRPRPDDDPT